MTLNVINMKTYDNDSQHHMSLTASHVPHQFTVNACEGCPVAASSGKPFCILNFYSISLSHTLHTSA